MSEKKNPFIGYTEAEIFASEAVTYIIQVGSEIFRVNGNCVFSKKSAATYYNKILRELLNNLYNGSREQQEHAKRVLPNLKVLPLRIH